MTWGVENVHLVFDVFAIGGVIELHHRGRYRDTTLLLDIHPVAGGSFLNLVAFYSSSHLYLSTEQQKLLCQCSLTRVRVRNDGKCTSSFYFLIHIFFFLGTD